MFVLSWRPWRLRRASRLVSFLRPDDRRPRSGKLSLQECLGCDWVQGAGESRKGVGQKTLSALEFGVTAAEQK